MPRASLSFAESAVLDLEAVLAWYEEQGVPQVGRSLVEEVLARVETLTDHPELGRIVPEFGQAFLRELIHPPFRLVYRLDPGQVRVVRVWRSERLMKE